jgi:DNA anti-recombination protein RmuC
MSTPNEKTDKAGKRSLEEGLREVWLDALGTLERTETELLRLGERIREAIVGDESAAAAFTARVRKQRAELERRVDEGVRHALARVADPLRHEIAALRERADKLAVRLDEQARRRARRRDGAEAPEQGATGGDGRTDGVAR